MKRILALSIIFTMMMVGSTFAAGFKDVQSNHWAYQSIQKAISQGVVQGYPDGTFKPNNQVTIAEFTTMLARSYNISDEIPTTGTFAANVSQFMKDKKYPHANNTTQVATRGQVADIIARSANVYLSGEDAIKFLLANDLAGGKVAGGLPTIANYKANDSLTRAEAVTFIQNIKSKGLEDGRITSSYIVKDKNSIENEYAKKVNTNIGVYHELPSVEQMKTKYASYFGSKGFLLDEEGSKAGNLQYYKGEAIFIRSGDSNTIGGVNPHGDLYEMIDHILKQEGYNLAKSSKDYHALAKATSNGRYEETFAGFKVQVSTSYGNKEYVGITIVKN